MCRKPVANSTAVSVDQVGADVGTWTKNTPFRLPVLCPSIRLVPTSAPGPKTRLFVYLYCVRRSGWCRRRHRSQPQRTRQASWCPSIRLVPTSAPLLVELPGPCRVVSVDQVGADVGTFAYDPKLEQGADVSVDQVGADVGTTETGGNVVHPSFVSVDQVGADVGTGPPCVSLFPRSRVRRSGWCRRRHRESGSSQSIRCVVSVDQVGADVGTKIGELGPQDDSGVRRSGWCRRRHQQCITTTY